MIHRVLVALFFLALISSCKHTLHTKNSLAALDAGDSSKALIAAGEYREALRELLRAESLDSNNSEIQYLLATVYLIGFNRLDEAKAHALDAIKLAETPYPEAENLAGAIFLELGNPKEAVEYLERAANNLLYETPYFAEQNLGRAFAELGNPKESVSRYAKAIAAQPELCGAYIPYSEQLMVLSQFRDAEENLLQFFKRCDSHDAQAQEMIKKIRAHMKKK